MIENSVGLRGVNDRNDALIIQSALNVCRSRKGQHWIKIDGLVGPETIGAISSFQKRNALPPDGRIDVGGPTIGRLKSLLGEEALVFGPTVLELVAAIETLQALAHEAPPRTRRHIYGRVIPRLNAVYPYADLSKELRGRSPFALAGFHGGQPQFGLVGVDDALELFLAAGVMAVLMTTFLILLTQSPEFRKAVEVRAKELDRILKDLQIHMSLGLKESIDLIVSIANDTIDEKNRCRKSPTFTPSPECDEAMKEFDRTVEKLRGLLPRLKRLVDLLTTGNRRGLDIHATRRRFETLLKEARQDTIDLQVSLASLRETCKCPDL